MVNNEFLELAEKAKSIRKEILNLTYSASSGHPGGSLSIVELITVLYFLEMRINPLETKDRDRDRFVLSKGHAAPALYAALKERGFLETTDMQEFRQVEGILQGHPDMKKIPGVDMSTGSLGQGISAAVGMALAGQLDNKDYRVYSILGDGELGEGQVWESAMAASHYKLDNLCVIFDVNHLQIDGDVQDVIGPLPLLDKAKAFGANVVECDGHDFESIKNAFESAKNCKGVPTVIVANTIKGKGVSFMENQAGWHGKAPNDEQLEIALKNLGE